MRLQASGDDDRPMNTTSPSLLYRLRERGEEGAWARFVKLYAPLLHFWARGVGLQEQDAADLTQEVLTTLVEKLPEFQYDPASSFRGWLRTIVLNKWRDRCRRKMPRAVGDDNHVLDVPATDDSNAFGEAEYRQHIVSRALQLMQTEFPAKMWKACWEHVAQGRPAAEVAAELGISPGTVYVAKARILSRLRVELQGLLD
jgi:RNA polymerase sigma-70 factor (ECF subfamily)